MADILGLVASILQLVDMVARTRNYVQDFRDAPKDQRRLLQEIQSLRTLILELPEINKLIKDRRFKGRLTGSMQNFGEPLNQLTQAIEQLAKKLDSRGLSKVTGRLAWPLWGKEDVKAGLQTIERFKSFFHLQLGMDIWYTAQGMIPQRESEFEHTLKQHLILEGHSHIITTVKDLAQDHREHNERTISTVQNATKQQQIAQAEISQYIKDVAGIQENDREAKKRDEIIKWYSPLNFSPRQAEIINTRQPETGLWLLEDPNFKVWKSGFEQKLLCRGMPGAGKTVLVSIVVDHLQAVAAASVQNIGVAVVYLNHKERDEHSPAKLLASLWRQLVFRRPISPTIHELYESHHEPGTRPFIKDDHAVLRSVIAEYSKVYIVVDALDEYPEKERDIFLGHLFSLDPTRVNLMLTSRPHIKIEDVGSNSDLQTLEIRAMEGDIRLLVDAQISRSRQLSKHIHSRPELRKEIETGIVGRNGGMFLLAKLQIESLAAQLTVKQIRDALNNMPDDLDSSYDEVMDRINRQGKHQRDISMRALFWIINAKRPLRPAELTEALAVDTAGLDLDNLLDMDTILSVCAGLVVLTDSGGSNEVIRLVHYTVQDYLERRQAPELPRMLTEITMTCIIYLSVELPKIHGRFADHHFLDYAVNYCLIHARGHPESSIKNSILSFLADCSKWLRLWNWNRRHAATGTPIPTSASRLWIAAYFSLEEISRCLIQEEGAGAVLQQAVSYSHTDAVRILLKNGADINAMDMTYGTAMDVALASQYSHDIFWVLIEHGADVNTGGEHGTPMHRATHHNDYILARFLIQHNANVHALGGTGHTALYTAASLGHLEIIRLLVENGADTNAKGGIALIAAARNGHYEAVRLLIAHGAEVNPTGLENRGVTALHVAAAGGHDEIARFLMEHGADKEARQKSGLSKPVTVPYRRSEESQNISFFYIGAYQPVSVLASNLERLEQIQNMERGREEYLSAMVEECFD
ncbi:hypothetical protein DFH09DRAFT_1332314 [Mycena vulgaris]|nr:hypothetical protein DFH09DRAFT_1332314 [Mycena vulgaris]